MLVSMKYWKPIRISLLAVTLGGILLVMGKIILYPSVERAFTPFEFPAAVPLPEWQMLESTPLPMPTEGSELKAAKRYTYQQNRWILAIEMRYLVDMEGKVSEFGKLEDWIKKFSTQEPSTVKLSVANTDGVGFYGFSQAEGRAYLNTCINSRGGSTATADQFMKNRNTYDLRWQRIFPWLLGQSELRDRRCLWTQMSVPLDRTTPETAYKTLETAWISWYRWWQPRFPRP